MRRAIAALLAAFLTNPPVSSGAPPNLGAVHGVVTVEGRPLRGVGLAFVDVRSGAIRRSTSANGGAFALTLAPGEYVVTTESGAGLTVGRGPSVVPVRAGETASLSVDLLALPGVVLPPAGDEAFAISHTPVGCLVAGEFALIEAGIEPAADVAKGRVYFKSALASGFYYVEMTRVEGRFVGKLPRPRIEASPILYYVAALSARAGESRTPQYAATVVNDKAECPEGQLVAPIGGPGAVQVFSAATGATVTPAGFAASGLALTSGLIALILGAAAAAGIAASVDVFNPQPIPSATPATPTPEPTPIPTPTPSPEPTPPCLCPCIP